MWFDDRAKKNQDVSVIHCHKNAILTITKISSVSYSNKHLFGLSVQCLLAVSPGSTEWLCRF